MVSMVACHAGDPGSNPIGPEDFSPWNYQDGGSGDSVTPESASGER